METHLADGARDKPKLHVADDRGAHRPRDHGSTVAATIIGAAWAFEETISNEMTT